MKATERYVIFSRKLEISACFNNQQGKVYIFIYSFIYLPVSYKCFM